MRILPHEQKEMHEAIDLAGYELADFRFVKRQGKLHLFYKDNPAPFKYFRKKETKLVSGKWEDKVFYVLYGNGKEDNVGEWKNVLRAFREWLDGL